MQLFSFSPGHPVRLFKERYVITDVRNDIITLRNAETDATRDFEISTLHLHYRAGNLKPEKPPKKLADRRPPRRVKRSVLLMADASEAAKARGRLMQAYLKKIDESGVPFKKGDAGLQEVLKSVAEERRDVCPPSFSSLARFRSRQLRAGGDPAACLPRYDLRGGVGKSRLSDAVERALQAAIDNHYMSIDGGSMNSAYEEFRRKVIHEYTLDEAFDEATLPSYSTFRRRVQQRGGYELYAARNGHRAAEIAFRHAQPSVSRPGLNEVWEIDHTRLDLLIVDALHGITARRPRLTVILEACTRVVMGFDVDFTGDSSQAVLNTLRHAITPKTYVHERYPDIKAAWPCHGVPSRLRCDNGVEFHSESVNTACDELGIIVEYCPARSPTSKGGVERFFRTLSEGFLRTLPGYAGPDLKRRKHLEDVNLPVIDLDTFMHMLHVWIIEVYMNDNGRRGGRSA